jgi:hypothetical protein
MVPDAQGKGKRNRSLIEETALPQEEALFLFGAL